MYTQAEIIDFLRYDFAHILGVDAIVVLDGWMYSKYANIEILLARAIGLKIYRISLENDLFHDLQEVTEVNPCELAAETVRITMGKGLAKHAADSWRDESQENHLLKCARHAITAQLQNSKLSPRDEEDHIANALCRAAMALAQTNGKHVKTQ